MEQLQNTMVIFYCMNCFHSFRTQNKLQSHEKVRRNKNLCGIVMPSEKDKVLEFNEYVKPDKMTCIIFADIESLIRKMDVQIIQNILQQRK